LSEDQAPDYSLDRWVKMAQDLGGSIGSMVGDAKRKEKDLDDEEAKQKKVEDQPSSDDEKETDVTKNKETEDAWQRLRKIAQERQEKETEKESSKDSEKSEKKS